MHRSKKFGFFAELQICFIGLAVSKIPVSFERLPNMAPFDLLLALFERPWLWNISPPPEGHLVWIVQNFKTLPARFCRADPSFYRVDRGRGALAPAAIWTGFGAGGCGSSVLAGRGSMISTLELEFLS